MMTPDELRAFTDETNGYIRSLMSDYTRARNAGNTTLPYDEFMGLFAEWMRYLASDKSIFSAMDYGEIVERYYTRARAFAEIYARSVGHPPTVQAMETPQELAQSREPKPKDWAEPLKYVAIIAGLGLGGYALSKVTK